MTSPPATGFLGLSHLGIVGSVGWASLGGPVTAVDLDPSPVEMLAGGVLPVHEPGLGELFASVRPRMTFSGDPAALAACSLVVVTRDVPTGPDDTSDVSEVLRLLDAALPHLRDGVTLVVMSQVPPGFMRALARRIHARRPGLAVRLYYWIETLVFGNAVRRYLEPERIMLGCADPAQPLPAELDAGLTRFRAPIFRMRYESAELTKTAINLYLCAAVTYANTLADLAEAVGADWTEMMPALRLDRRIGAAAYIRPSLGIAGGNLERDMVTLRTVAAATGVDASFIDTMLGYNARRYRWVEKKLAALVFPTTPHPTLAVWGLAYKKDTRSIKNSFALKVIDELLDRATVRAYDPRVTAADVRRPIEVVSSAEAALAGADALLVVTDWDEFAALPADGVKAMKRPLVIDCVGVVDLTRVRAGEIEYVGMGRGPAR